ncbi:hypothetical protein [Nocardioides litoris]|uniref:hypothetical protein n=1 Tax=Nocardioides litoris TaxID=1926648 RepID=UPI00111D253C|nr:hypothetical protein [Nocardioides litoris]
MALALQALTLADSGGSGSPGVFWAPGATYGTSAADWPFAVLWLLGAACAAAALSGRRRGWAALGLAALLTIATLSLMKGDGPRSGTTVLAFSTNYGVNSGDLPWLALLLVGVLACAVVGTPRRSRPARRTIR